MSKKLSIILLSVIILLTVFFGIFAYIPQFDFGNADVYHSPASLIQRGLDIGSVTWATYKVDQGDLTDEQLQAGKDRAVSVLSSRFGYVFGYYGSEIKYLEDGSLYMAVPSTTAHDGVDAEDVISNVARRGKIEFIPETTYSEEDVIMSSVSEEKMFKSASVNQYVSGTSTWYIVTIDLTNEGKTVAAQNITPSTSSASAYCAIDGVVSYQVVYPSLNANYVQVYVGGTTEAKTVASFVNSGALAFEIDEIEVDVIPMTTRVGLIIGLVMFFLLVAVAVFLAVRYGMVGLSSALAIAIAAIGVTYFAGLAYFSVLNIAAIIGFVLGIALVTYLTCDVLEKFRRGVVSGKSVKSSLSAAFNTSWKRNLIVNGIALVVGIILWVIPTSFTVSLGNAIVYSTVLSLIVTLGLNRLFALMVYPVAEENAQAYGVKKK